MLNHFVVPLLIVVSGFICLEYFIPIAIGEFVAGIIGGLIFIFGLVVVKKVVFLVFGRYKGNCSEFELKFRNNLAF